MIYTTIHLKMKNPTDFPLYIYVGRDDGEDMRLAAKFPNAAWIPRIGERLVLPEGDKSQASQWLLVTVELVVHDLVGEVVNLFCKRIKAGAISRKEPSKQILNNKNSSQIMFEAFEVIETRSLSFQNQPTAEDLLFTDISMEQVDEELAALRRSLLE